LKLLVHFIPFVIARLCPPRGAKTFGGFLTFRNREVLTLCPPGGSKTDISDMSVLCAYFGHITIFHPKPGKTDICFTPNVCPFCTFCSDVCSLANMSLRMRNLCGVATQSLHARTQVSVPPVRSHTAGMLKSHTVDTKSHHADATRRR